MSFQWIFDNAQSISVNQRGVVSSTTSRDGTVRATSRGGQVWRFEVVVPEGPRWSDYRQNIATAEALDRFTTSTISLSDAGYTSWLLAYQGNAADKTAITASWTTGNTITLTGGQATSGYNFRAGDVIQLGASGSCYTVSADVAWNNNVVTLSRPLLDAADTGVTLRVAENCVWTVICTQFPDWNIFARDQISWSGPFVFYESLV